MTALPIPAVEIDHAAAAVLDVLWRCSWQASVLAAVVLLVQFALRERLSARWRHALWVIGLAWMLARIAGATLFLALSARQMKRVADKKLLALLGGCRRMIGVR